MSDGKVMQKYYPPEFDPEDLRKKKHVLRAMTREKNRRGGSKHRERTMEMRMMFPFTLQCENCRDFVYVGTKFNSKVTKIKGEDYLGIPLWRFYGRCPHCRNQIVMRTDPKTTDYILESGGVRTYDSNRDVLLAEQALESEQQQQADEDAIKALELKSYSTAAELKTLETLDQLRRLNQRLMGRPDKLSEFALEKLQDLEDAKEDQLDEEEMEKARLEFLKRDESDSDQTDGDGKEGDGEGKEGDGDGKEGDGDSERRRGDMERGDRRDGKELSSRCSRLFGGSKETRGDTRLKSERKKDDFDSLLDDYADDDLEDFLNA